MADLSPPNTSPAALALGTANTAIGVQQVIQQLQQIVLQLSQMNQIEVNKFPNFVTVPANSSAAGVAGQLAYDATHLYLCVASNSWIRFTGATF